MEVEHMAVNTANDPERKNALILPNESDREREFYRYYRPIRELNLNRPLFCDMKNQASFDAHDPTPSPDPTLTAFCQLAALRLEARRSMMFFFDSKNAYVLAEATRTLSLHDATVQHVEDRLWLGHTIIPRGVSVCETTVRLPAFPLSAEHDSSDPQRLHVINDLAEDAKYCDRPFVAGGPRARFYAGIPITTPSGVNIGAFCVLDDKPRDGLTPSEHTFMYEMSGTIATHLEILRSAAESQLGTQMITGLGAFIDGASSLRESIEQDTAQSIADSAAPSTIIRENQDAATLTVPAIPPSPKVGHRDKQPPEPSMPPNSADNILAVASSWPSRTDAPQAPQKLRPSRDQRKKKSRPREAAFGDVNSIFHRAAGLMRKASNVDGVQFVDARFGAKTTFSSQHPAIANSSSGHNGATASDVSSSRKTGVDADNSETEGMCDVFASSCDTRPNQITQKLLQKLLKRYRNGKIWFFDEAERIESVSERASDYCPDTAPLSDSDSLNTGSTSSAPSPISSSIRSTKRGSRDDDRREILRLFPGARCVCFVGMWDHSQQRWYSAGFSWTYSPFRLFSDEFDVKYLTAFCDVILTELQRLEAMRSDRAKSDFISTISHELRSPLHGILGSVELLHGLPSDPLLSSSDLISQVEVCSRTLLDVIDHLLDYSGINQLSKSGASLSSRKKSSKTITAADSANAMRDRDVDSGLEIDVDLDRITEEVVEATLYSFCFSRDRAIILDREVSVVLEIDNSLDYKCNINIGAWKRVCINLVSNALKYTTKGHVCVKLAAERLDDASGNFRALLEVQDTGCGMSRDFLENHLFTAFTQENSFVEGTGLGLNLVAKIVRDSGGRIDVRSEKGTGSVFSVSLPVQAARRDSGYVSRSSSASNDDLPRDLVVGLIGTEETPEPLDPAIGAAQSLVASSIRGKLADLKIKQIHSDSTTQHDADLHIITETRLRQELIRFKDEHEARDGHCPGEAKSNVPLVVICDSVISARTFTKAELRSVTAGQIELILQPVGPHRLRKAITACVKSTHSPSKAAVNLNAEAHAASGAALPIRTRPSASSSNSEDSLTSKPHRRRAGSKKPSVRSSKRAPDKLPARSGSSSSNSAPLTFSSRATASGLRLLLVDDNAVNMKLLVTFAERTGYIKRTATDGKKAVEIYSDILGVRARTNAGAEGSANIEELQDRGSAKDRPAAARVEESWVVLMDINMPLMDGYEATKQIRALEKKSRSKPAMIIGLSGLGSEAARQSAFAAGMDLFLTKPVRLQELRRILNDLHDT